MKYKVETLIRNITKSEIHIYIYICVPTTHISYLQYSRMLITAVNILNAPFKVKVKREPNIELILFCKH